jgi:hypothetical protein
VSIISAVAFLTSSFTSVAISLTSSVTSVVIWGVDALCLSHTLTYLSTFPKKAVRFARRSSEDRY